MLRHTHPPPDVAIEVVYIIFIAVVQLVQGYCQACQVGRACMLKHLHHTHPMTPPFTHPIAHTMTRPMTHLWRQTYAMPCPMTHTSLVPLTQATDFTKTVHDTNVMFNGQYARCRSSALSPIRKRIRTLCYNVCSQTHICSCIFLLPCKISILGTCTRAGFGMA